MRLIADNLCGERGGERIFESVNFSIDRGQALLVTGPNGSGKSTLLRIIAALLPAASGRVWIEGMGEEHPAVASACHYLGHANAMKTALSVIENLDFWQRFGGAHGLGIAQSLEAVGLADIGHLPYGYLSTGQKRRISIARLLVSHRPIWLLDEPTAGLDKASETRFAGLMKTHLEDGGLIVAATHLPLGLTDATELRMGSIS